MSLTVTKSTQTPTVPFISSVTPGSPGGVAVWTITITNSTTGPVGPLLVRDPVPPPFFGSPLVPGYGDLLWTVVGVNYELAYPGTLAVGQSTTLTFVLPVLTAPPASYNNTVNVYDSTGTTLLGSSSSSVDFVLSIPAVPLLQVRKYVDSASLTSGGYIKYNIVVTNVGQASFTGTVVLNDIPGLGLQWNGLDGWTLVGSNLTKPLVITALAPGGSVSTSITFNIVSCVNLLLNTIELFSGETRVSRDSVALDFCCEKKSKKYECLKL